MTRNEAAERLLADLRTIPVRSGIEYRSWEKQLDEALAAERRAERQRIREAGEVGWQRRAWFAEREQVCVIPVAILEEEANR